MDKEFLDALANFTAVAQNKLPKLQAQIEKEQKDKEKASDLLHSPTNLQKSPTKYEDDCRRREDWKTHADQRVKECLA